MKNRAGRKPHQLHNALPPIRNLDHVEVAFRVAKVIIVCTYLDASQRAFIASTVDQHSSLSLTSPNRSGRMLLCSSNWRTMVLLKRSRCLNEPRARERDQPRATINVAPLLTGYTYAALSQLIPRPLVLKGTTPSLELGSRRTRLYGLVIEPLLESSKSITGLYLEIFTLIWTHQVRLSNSKEIGATSSIYIVSAGTDCRIVGVAKINKRIGTCKLMSARLGMRD